ncbi:MAG TPA: sterol desaturase family protein [Acetobacteraceae bacterium]|nr:sterol desaturase family protein [Acetobacteraceae bacterium]
MLAYLHQLPPILLTTIRLSVWLLILCTIFLPLELLFSLPRQKLLRRSLPSDIGFYFISGLVPQLLLAVPLSLAAYVAYHFVPWRVHAAIAAWPIWLRALAAFVVGDFGFYWGHRWTHAIPFLWRFHALHHHPEHVYFLVSARAHPVDNAFIRLCGLVPIYVLGLGAPQSVRGTLVATLVMLAVPVWGFFIHANLRWRLGPLEWLIATPGFHHWHHTRSELRDRNFASMLPWMDWLFGTCHLPKEWPAAYGTDTPLPASMIGQLLYPLRDPREAQALSEPAGVNPR